MLPVTLSSWEIDQQRTRQPTPDDAHLWLPLVRSLAGRIWREGAARLAGLDIDDLIGLGTVGLLRASRKFDASRGVPFGAFAAPYILGAMRDGLRCSGGATRRRAAEYFRAAGIRPRKVDARAVADVPARDASPELCAMLSEALHRVAKLPELQRRLLLGVVVDGREYSDVGAEAGVSKGWAWKLTARAQRAVAGMEAA